MEAGDLSLLAVPLVGSLAYGGGDFIGGRASLRLSPVGVIVLAQVSEHTPGHGPHFSFCLGVAGGLADGAADVCLGIPPPAPAFDALLLARAVMAAIALALFLAILARRGAPRSGTRPLTLVIAALLAIAAGICDALGHLAYVALATAGSIAIASALVGALGAAVVILLAVALLRERLSAPQLAGMATGALGVLTLST